MRKRNITNTITRGYLIKKIENKEENEHLYANFGSFARMV